MSESEKQTEDQNEENKKSPLTLILLVFAVLAVILGAGLYDNAQKTAAPQNAPAPAEEAATAPGTSTEVTAENTGDSEATGTAEAEQITLNIESLGTPRILGNPDAPIKISEHSSFTCPACAMFHKTNFKEIKAEYIDTGKAYLVFDDFPRNSYDVLIGSIARCVPEQAYFNFVQLVFETQKEWLANKDFIDYMKQNAKLTGISEETIEACINSTELQEVLAKRQYDAGEAHNIKATPTLIINDSASVSGLAQYEEITTIIETELQKAAQ